jgi:hypothetical protein
VYLKIILDVYEKTIRVLIMAWTNYRLLLKKNTNREVIFALLVHNMGTHTRHIAVRPTHRTPPQCTCLV